MNVGAALWRGMRPQQWTKNAVVAAAGFFAAGEKGFDLLLGHLPDLLRAVAAFCLASSSIYLINDIRDRDLDRRHPQKRLRPVASGALSVRGAALGAVGLLPLAAALAWPLGGAFLAILGGYWCLQTAYSFGLKRVAYLDVAVIAAGFLLRVLGGAFAVQVPISHWLLTCTFLLATYLGLGKRRHEKVVLGGLQDSARPSLRQVDERTLDQALALAAGAVLTAYALYTVAPDTVAKFGDRRLLLTLPLVAAGLWRYHRLIYKHEEGGRPERTLVTDPGMLGVSLAYAALTWLLFALK
jgi:4-hydroxybenzoate polyprenyltransferase